MGKCFVLLLVAMSCVVCFASPYGYDEDRRRGGYVDENRNRGYIDQNRGRETHYGDGHALTGGHPPMLPGGSTGHGGNVGHGSVIGLEHGHGGHRDGRGHEGHRQGSYVRRDEYNQGPRYKRAACHLHEGHKDSDESKSSEEHHKPPVIAIDPTNPPTPIPV